MATTSTGTTPVSSVNGEGWEGGPPIPRQFQGLKEEQSDTSDARGKRVQGKYIKEERAARIAVFAMVGSHHNSCGLQCIVFQRLPVANHGQSHAARGEGDDEEDWQSKC
eukprot:2121888-Rhodomonas_salina.2